MYGQLVGREEGGGRASRLVGGAPQKGGCFIPAPTSSRACASSSHLEELEHSVSPSRSAQEVRQGVFVVDREEVLPPRCCVQWAGGDDIFDCLKQRPAGAVHGLVRSESGCVRAKGVSGY
jgi:hypothetical protein